MIEFEWDQANIAHLKRHRVTPREFEQAMQNDPVELDFEDTDGEERVSAVGVTDEGRLLFLVWTPRNGKVRAITAYKAGPLATKEWSSNR